MKKVEERTQVELRGTPVARPRSLEPFPGEVWGDHMPIVRLGGEVGFVGPGGVVYESVEAAFVHSGVGCGCLTRANQAAQVGNYVQALNKIAQFLTLVALKRKPSEIASLMFYDEMFMFETFSSHMEDRELVEHVPGEMVDGYYPLGLTDEGAAGLRMCLESEMVDLPFDKQAVGEALFEKPLQIMIELSEEAPALPKPAQSQGRISDLARINRAARRAGSKTVVL